MAKNESRNVIRLRRHARVRNKISGTPERPRLNVFRSNSHIHAQIIDDTKGVTLVSASSVDMKLEMVQTLKQLLLLVQKSLREHLLKILM